jgi:soluble lytic murein transglycosylase-like protein
MPPSCSAFAANQMLFAIPDFDPPMAVLQLINQSAQRKNLNPFFVAALVAQESSFDPRALSRGKALGLTQVTSLGESEIIKRFDSWPRYPGLESIPLPLLKVSIMAGRIHSGNEWRLDPAHSIEGGVEYLSYLSDYWSRPDKRAQIERKLGPGENAMSEVMLASYNSGAARVSDALERDGSRWLQDEELGEARKYVRRIVSYCDHFEHRED